MAKSDDGYKRIPIPEGIIHDIEDYMKAHPDRYTSISEFIRECVRNCLNMKELSKADLALLDEIRKRR